MPEPLIGIEIREIKQKSDERRGVISFLTSAGGGAILSVLLGGMAAQFVTCYAQREAQQREFNNTWLKARGDQALLARKDYLDRRSAALDEILRVAGSLATASDDLLYVTRPSFSTAGHTKANKRRILAEQTKLHSAFVAAEQAWAPSQMRYTSMVAALSIDNEQAMQSWQHLRASVNDLSKCASDTYEKWYLAGQRIGSFTYDPRACRSQYDLVGARAQTFGHTFGIMAEQPWAGWNNPAALKKDLGIEE